MTALPKIDEVPASVGAPARAVDAYTAAQSAQDAAVGHTTRTFSVWRGEHGTGAFRDFTVETNDGMVVLDAVHRIQAEQANDLAVRWNCKAGKCGSCSAEINGKPKLMCMTRLQDLPADEPVTVEPMRAFPHLRDLVTDVSWNYRVKPRIQRFTPRAPDAPDGTWRIDQRDVDRVQEFRKCIECFLCQDVCHVLRDHHKQEEFIGPRFLVYVAALEMHPLDGAQGRLRDRLLQHHQVLHEGVPRGDHDHRQRDHSAQGARRRPALRSAAGTRAAGARPTEVLRRDTGTESPRRHTPVGIPTRERR
jgi:succinate dehydrogenase / fumarate reductase iron-sulfur subunit